MSSKMSFLQSTVQHKCPRCHQGDLFEHKNPYRIKGFFAMHKECPHCGQRFELEPGFYYGAMYVNYGFTIALSVATFVAMYVLGGSWEVHEYLIGIGLVLLVTAPYNFRLARSLWIHFFVKEEVEA